MTRARERLILTSTYPYTDPKYSPGKIDRPIKWLAGAPEIEESLPEGRVQQLGEAAVQVECFSPERIAPMRDIAVQQLDASLAAARQAVRDSLPVVWEAPNVSPADVDAIVNR